MRTEGTRGTHKEGNTCLPYITAQDKALNVHLNRAFFVNGGPSSSNTTPAMRATASVTTKKKWFTAVMTREIQKR